MSNISQQDIDAGDNIDGWDCQDRDVCLEIAIVKNLVVLPCKNCKEYKPEVLNIMDYITTRDSFNEVW